MLNIGPQELIIVFLIALIVVGPKRLPELGRSIGRALSEFRKVQDDVRDTIRFDLGEGGSRVSPHTPPDLSPSGDGVSPNGDRADGPDVTEPSADPAPPPSPE